MCFINMNCLSLSDIHMKSSHYRVNDFISGALESSIDSTILADLTPYIDIKVRKNVVSDKKIYLGV